jgi:hypothetical protein
LTALYFQGDAPALPVNATVFPSGSQATIYYLPGTTGWGATFGGLPTVLWNPEIQNPGVSGNEFGFTLTGSTNLVVVVEACANLADPTWFPVGTNTLNGGLAYVSDPQWTNDPARFYRLRSS